MKKIIYVFLFCILTVTGWAQENEWVQVKSEKMHLSFRLPGQPQKEEADLNGIKVEKFQYRDVANIFGIVASDFTGTGVDFSHIDPQDYYENMKQASLVTNDAILVSEQTIAYKRILGKEIKYTQLVKGREYTYFKRFFFRGKFVYQVAIGGPTRLQKVLLDKKDLFFSSIEFQ